MANRSVRILLFMPFLTASRGDLLLLLFAGVRHPHPKHFAKKPNQSKTRAGAGWRIICRSPVGRFCRAIRSSDTP